MTARSSAGGAHGEVAPVASARSAAAPANAVAPNATRSGTDADTSRRGFRLADSQSSVDGA